MTQGASAGFSRCGRYRYWVRRCWDEGRPPVCWVMLNPSTADAVRDDPTIRRCRQFAAAWGYGGILVVNLFAYRASAPALLFGADDPIGPANDRHLRRAVAGAAQLVVAAWGCHGTFRGRDRAVLELLASCTGGVVCLGRTRNGQPRHPLYVRGNQPLERFVPAAGT